MYGIGISREGSVLDTAVKAEIVKKAGSWFSYNEQRLGQGRENVKNYLLDNPALLEELDLKVRDFYDIGEKKGKKEKKKK